MPKTIFLHSWGKESSVIISGRLNEDCKSFEAGAEIYLDEVSRRLRLDDYFGHPAQVLRLLNSNIPDWAEKIILKSRPEDRRFFSEVGYREEASVHGYFLGMDMHFMVYYLNEARSTQTEYNSDVPAEPGISFSKRSEPSTGLTQIHKASAENAEEIAVFYSKIFPLYPTPVTDPKYLKKVIDGDSIYRFIRQDGIIVSAACAEVNQKYRNAELSDCGTLTEVSGKGFMKSILLALMDDLNNLEVKSIYSIARAASPSMNAVFKGLGFDFTGTLLKNVLIYSGFEDMNVWSRNLKRERV